MTTATTNGGGAAKTCARCNGPLGLELYTAHLISAHRLLPEAACFYLLVHPIELEADREWRAHPEEARIQGELEAIRRKYQVGSTEACGWDQGGGPKEYLALEREYEERSRRLHAELLEEHAGPEVAELARNRPDAFRRRVAEGRAFFYDPISDETDRRKRDFEAILKAME